MGHVKKKWKQVESKLYSAYKLKNCRSILYLFLKIFLQCNFWGRWTKHKPSMVSSFFYDNCNSLFILSVDYAWCPVYCTRHFQASQLITVCGNAKQLRSKFLYNSQGSYTFNKSYILHLSRMSYIFKVGTIWVFLVKLQFWSIFGLLFSII